MGNDWNKHQTKATLVGVRMANCSNQRKLLLGFLGLSNAEQAASPEEASDNNFDIARDH